MAEAVEHLIPDPVEWHEGMLLAPQHFQQLSTRVEFQLQRLTAGAALPAWGVRRCVLGTDRLAAGVFRLLEADVTLRDGYRFRVERAHGLELDLSPLADQARQESLFVFVTVPVSPGLGTEGELARYRSEEFGPVRDATGESQITLPVLRPKVSLWAGIALPARLEGVPVARIRRREEAFTLEPYQPPVPELAPDSELHAGCAAVAQLARDKALLLAERLQNGSLAGDLSALWQARSQLSHLTASLPGLEVLLADGGVHPRLLHLRLCDLAGQLASLSFGLVPPHFPAYDHGDLTATFRPLLQFAGQAMAEGVSEKWQRIRLTGKGSEYRCVPDGWLDQALAMQASSPGECLVALGLRCPGEAGVAAMQRWCAEAVVAGAGALEELLESRTLGLGRRWVNQLPGLVAPPGVCLFALETNAAVLGAREEVVVLGSADVEPGPVEVMLFVRRAENGRATGGERNAGQ